MNKGKHHKNPTKRVGEYYKELRKHLDGGKLYYSQCGNLLFVNYLSQTEDAIMFATEQSTVKKIVRDSTHFYYLTDSSGGLLFKSISNPCRTTLDKYYDYLCEQMEDNELFCEYPSRKGALGAVHEIGLNEDFEKNCIILHNSKFVACIGWSSEFKVYSVSKARNYLEEITMLLTMKQFEEKEQLNG